ncbi:hypothetical protein OSTOST_24676, partial [Ostertagia ostertagi]
KHKTAAVCARGVRLLSSDQKRHELCTEEICLAFDSSQVDETIRFPPHVILHEHVVQWKFEENGTIHTLEITCPAAPFCENIDCTLCADVLLKCPRKETEDWVESFARGSTILNLILPVGDCQELNVLSHHERVLKGKENLSDENQPFKKAACIKLRSNFSVVRES